MYVLYCTSTIDISSFGEVDTSFFAQALALHQAFFAQTLVATYSHLFPSSFFARALVPSSFFFAQDRGYMRWRTSYVAGMLAWTE